MEVSRTRGALLTYFLRKRKHCSAMRSIVGRDTGESYEEFLRRLAKASGLKTPTREELAPLDRKRKKRISNKEWRVTWHGANQSELTTLEETLSEAGIARAELVGREAELGPEEKPKVPVNGIAELVTDKNYHSGAVVERVQSYEVRGSIPERQPKRRRNWQGKVEEQQAVYQNRWRVRSEHGKSLLRQRELGERSLARDYETGGMRRTHRRRRQNILKRQLIHVGAFNRSLLLRTRLRAGPPREWKNRKMEGCFCAYFCS